MTTFNSLDTFTEIAAANGDTLKSAVEIGLNATEQIFALQLNTLRSLSTGAVPVTEGNPAEQIAAQFKVPGRALEQISDYLRNLGDILARTQGEFARLHGERCSETVDAFKQLLDGLAKSGPNGSAEFLNQVKSAITSTSEAYERFLRSTQEATETQFAAASSALQPIVTGSKPAKKAA